MNITKIAISISKIIFFGFNSLELRRFVFSRNYTMFIHIEPFLNVCFTKNIKPLDDFSSEFDAAQATRGNYITVSYG